MCRLDGLTNPELSQIRHSLIRGISALEEQERAHHTLDTAKDSLVLRDLITTIFREDEQAAEKDPEWLSRPST